jgi:hypothetical protein
MIVCCHLGHVSHGCGEIIMIRSLGYLATALVIALAAIVPTAAQFGFPDPAEPEDPPPLAGTPKKKAAPRDAGAAGTAGTWSGKLMQVDKDDPYNFQIAINAGGGETKYPDLNCTGKLTRAGASKSYTFFVEVISQGRHDKGGRCPDGTITVARQGNDLSLSWFGSILGNTIVAYGILSKR